MDPKDVNRINYSNYCVGQNLDFLVRSKMRSESLSTPLTNTPIFYDDQVTAKMALLGKRGYYDPGYIYGFDNQVINQNTNTNNTQTNNNYKENPRQLNYQKQINNPNELQIEHQNQEQNYFYNGKEINQNERNNNYQQEINQNEMNMGNKKNYHENSIQNNNYQKENDMRQYEEYIRGKMQENEDNKYINGEFKGGLNLPKTREQIQYDVYVENFKRQQLLKQMQQEENNSRQNYYK